MISKSEFYEKSRKLPICIRRLAPGGGWKKPHHGLPEDAKQPPRGPEAGPGVCGAINYTDCFVVSWLSFSAFFFCSFDQLMHAALCSDFQWATWHSLLQ